jgi:hypothetical protein
LSKKFLENFDNLFQWDPELVFRITKRIMQFEINHEKNLTLFSIHFCYANIRRNANEIKWKRASISLIL